MTQATRETVIQRLGFFSLLCVTAACIVFGTFPGAKAAILILLGLAAVAGSSMTLLAVDGWLRDNPLEEPPKPSESSEPEIVVEEDDEP